jgi:hypothetical protein
LEILIVNGRILDIGVAHNCLYNKLNYLKSDFIIMNIS